MSNLSQLEGSPASAASVKSLEEREAEALDTVLAEEAGASPQGGAPVGTKDSTAKPEAGAESAVADSTPDAQVEPTPEADGDAKTDDASETTDAATEVKSDEAKSEKDKPAEEKPFDLKDVPPEWKNWKKRVADAQMKMHEATKAKAETDKRAKALEERLAALEKAQEGTKPEVESVLGDLDEATKAMLTETPELKTLVGALLKRIDGLEKATGKTVDEKLKAEADAVKAAAEDHTQNNWRRTILEENPDFFDLIQTENWSKWRDRHADTVTATLSRFDQYDPKGALELLRLYERDQASKAAGAGSRKPATPELSLKGKSGQQPAGKPAQPVARSRQQMEDEALDLVLSEMAGK